jgi:hypothetical protein
MPIGAYDQQVSVDLGRQLEDAPHRAASANVSFHAEWAERTQALHSRAKGVSRRLELTVQAGHIAVRLGGHMVFQNVHDVQLGVGPMFCRSRSFLQSELPGIVEGDGGKYDVRFSFFLHEDSLSHVALVTRDLDLLHRSRIVVPSPCSLALEDTRRHARFLRTANGTLPTRERLRPARARRSVERSGAAARTCNMDAFASPIARKRPSACATKIAGRSTERLADSRPRPVAIRIRRARLGFPFGCDLASIEAGGRISCRPERKTCLDLTTLVALNALDVTRRIE